MVMVDTLAGRTPPLSGGALNTSGLISVTPSYQTDRSAADGFASEASDEGLVRRTWIAGQTIAFVCVASFALWAAIGYGIVRLLAH